MEKRVLLAIALSFLVLMVYSSMLPKQQPIENKYVAKEITREAAKPSQDQKIYNHLENNELYNIENDGLILKFSKSGAFIYEVFDKRLNSTLSIKNIGLVKEWSDYPFIVSEIQGGVVFEYATGDGFKIRKSFKIKPDNALELLIGLYDITNYELTSYNLFLGNFISPANQDPISARYYEASFLLNDAVSRKPTHGLKNRVEYLGNIRWAGLRDRYFCSLIVPELSVNKGVVDILKKDVYLALNVPVRSSGPIEDRFKIYIGPQDETLLKRFGTGAERIINYGMFDGISKGLMFLLSAVHKVTKNWGSTIIFVTILVYFLLFPLSFKSMLSMKKMQALQPKIEELRVKHKESPQKLNIEIMQLYKMEKVNPFGGCLPMVLQIPVFFALYQLLMRLISLKGAPFLWIKDLSEPDRLIVFKGSLPFIGNEFNLLPILMAGGMFIQQKLSSSSVTSSSSTAEQQKIMAIFMPVIFGVLFYKMPSGLVLYWFTNSLLMLGFQWKISKRKT